MLPSGPMPGSVSKADLEKMLNVATERIALQERLISGYRTMYAALDVLDTIDHELPLPQRFSMALYKLTAGAQQVLSAKMQQEEYHFAELLGQQQGIKKMLELLNSHIIRPTHHQ